MSAPYLENEMEALYPYAIHWFLDGYSDAIEKESLPFTQPLGLGD